MELGSSVIRPQLGSGNRPVCAAYGKVLYTAWKDAQSAADDGETSDNEETAKDKRRRSNAADKDQHSDPEQHKAAQAVEDAVQSLLQEGVHAADAKYFRGVRFLMQVGATVLYNLSFVPIV
jgi:hypothetical protein